MKSACLGSCPQARTNARCAAQLRISATTGPCGAHRVFRNTVSSSPTNRPSTWIDTSEPLGGREFGSPARTTCRNAPRKIEARPWMQERRAVLTRDPLPRMSNSSEAIGGLCESDTVETSERKERHVGYGQACPATPGRPLPLACGPVRGRRRQDARGLSPQGRAARDVPSGLPSLRLRLSDPVSNIPDLT